MRNFVLKNFKVNKIKLKKLNFKFYLKLSLAILILTFGFNILSKLNLSPITLASNQSIFDNGLGGYFGQGDTIADHNVLPPIYNFYRSNDTDKEPYAVDIYGLTGVYNDSLRLLYGVKRESRPVTTPITSILTKIEQYEQDARSSQPNYSEYASSSLNSVGTVNQCITTFNRGYEDYVITPLRHVTESEYNKRFPQCKSWIANGYKFLRFSLVGVPRSKPKTEEVYNSYKTKFQSQADHLVVTLQYMGNGGSINHSVHAGGDPTKPAHYSVFNTAINEQRNDVVGYNGSIAPSMALVVWEKNATTPKARWVLRLKCANPIGSSVDESSAQISVNVKPSTELVHLPNTPNSKQDVTFTYKIHKRIVGFPGKDTTINYNFSSVGFYISNPTVLSAPTIKATEVTPTNIVSLGSSPNQLSGSQASIDIDHNTQIATITYKETVTLTHQANNKNRIWQTRNPSEGYICRTIKGQHKSPPNNLPDDIKANLKAQSSACIRITFSQPPTGDGTVFVQPITPTTASITTPILPLYGGINSYVKRNRQWSYWHERQLKVTGTCGNSAAQVTSALNAQKDQICKDDPNNYKDCKYKTAPVVTTECKSYRTEGTRRICTCLMSSGTATAQYQKRETGAKWQITKMIFKPESNTSIESKAESTNSQTPCSHFGLPDNSSNSTSSCSTMKSGDYDFDDTTKISRTHSGLIHTNVTPRADGLEFYNDPKNLGGLDDAPYSTESLPTGTKVCFALSIYPWRNGGSDPKLISSKEAGNNQWRHSQPKCFIVSKKPYFTVDNGMVITNGNIVTNTNRRPDNTKYGSRIEYGAIAENHITKLLYTNFNPSIRTPSYQYTNWNQLTFANTNTPQLGNIGYDPTRSPVNEINYFKSFKNGEYSYANTKIHKPNTNENSHTNIGGNLSGIYIYSGKVNITQNIIGTNANNQGPLKNNNQVVIVVDGDLTINHNVTQINAWLIVKGTLYTSEYPLAPSQPNPIQQARQNETATLTINGPVQTNHIKLRRTYGGGLESTTPNTITPKHPDQKDIPAEAFNDTPSTYIWSYYNALNKGLVQTVYLREVAPRY